MSVEPEVNPELKQEELEEASKRSSITVRVVHEAVRLEGEEEFEYELEAEY